MRRVLARVARSASAQEKGTHLMLRRMLLVLAAVTLLLAAAVPAGSAQEAADRSDRNLPESVSDNRLDTPLTATIDRELISATGPQRVIIRLAEGAVAEAPAAARGLANEIANGQDDFIQRARSMAPDATVLARTQIVLNAVFMEVDASRIAAIAADPDVLSVHRVRDYQLDLSETVPYIGASAVQADGFDGTGISVAVLDSGIDYTHAAFGGSGDPAEYAADDPTIIEAGSFPTAKVVDGYDFVGSDWPNAPEAPDPDPIDDGPEAGHGTHVGHIIAGVGGVAPGADLYAVKVCSSVSTSCSGIALIQGMEFAVDPNGDGDASDAVDVINMSLGSNYGAAFDDDLSQAVENASALGVLTVSSAGNGSDKYFITGTPSSAPSALSVAQTQVPSAQLQVINLGDAEIPAVFQPWSVPLAAPISGPVQYGDGAGGNLDGCAPFTTDLTGLVVLVDRGACNFTLKIKTIGDAGGALGIIGLVAPGAPFSGGDGGDAPITITGFMISQDDANLMKANLGATATVDPANGIPLIGQMVGSSSRGPANDSYILKPEIGAPGASVSAVAGTGTGEGAFGGTSGASPMVAGSAALLLQAHPGLSPAEAKALLVNTGDTDIDTDPFVGLAPVSRIGGGEVRVDAAVDANIAAWDRSSLLPSVSYGYIDVGPETIRRVERLTVQNYSDRWQRYDVSAAFRFADDEASGAVEIDVFPATVRLRPGQSRTVRVIMTIHGDLLPGNYLSSGSDGASGDLLALNEFDGYIYFDGVRGDSIHVPWHVLPRAASKEKAIGAWALDFVDGLGEVLLRNRGVGVAQNNAYSLLGVSENLPEGGAGEGMPVPDLKAAGVVTFPVDAGFCSDNPSFVWQFATNLWERSSHRVPDAYIEWALDTNQDGLVDYFVYDFDLSLSGSISDGRSVTWVDDLAGGTSSAFFFTEHATNSGNVVHTICAEQIGLGGDDLLATNVDVLAVSAIDFYFGGPGDTMGPFTITPLGEQYVALPPDVPGFSEDVMPVIDYGPWPGNTPELGVMVVTDGDRGFGAHGGSQAWSELIVVPDRANARAVWDVLRSR